MVVADVKTFLEVVFHVLRDIAYRHSYKETCAKLDTQYGVTRARGEQGKERNVEEEMGKTVH